jgi:hypothetical protein
VNNDRLHVNELQIVKQAIQGLFYYLDVSRFEENDVKELCSVETLYLPSRDEILKDAKCLVYSDNADFGFFGNVQQYEQQLDGTEESSINQPIAGHSHPMTSIQN